MTPKVFGFQIWVHAFVSCMGYLGVNNCYGASTRIGQHTFTLPEGFEIELVAGPPLVERPIVADFDDQGRLYVADSSGSNAKVQQQLAAKPHRIVRLEDTDGDGIYDESVVYAEDLMFPEGVLWHQGAVYCGAPPEIWRLEDTDDDGIADKREVWFDAKTLTGCANDIHGPYMGKDGWIYWSKGAFAEQTHTLFDGRIIKDSAAHIFRCLPDGSEFDSVMSGGMDNPVEIAFDDAGEIFFTTTFYSHPRAGKRDALVHAIYGGVYPKEHGVLEGLTVTGEFLPAMTHLGPAAPSGLMRYESSRFGREFQGNLFSSHFNLRRIQRHQLIEDGTSFRTLDSDFVVSSHHDFHPTDVLEDGDGTMLVVDTGGWYKLCCPTSQLYKPDVLGAIYRVKRTANKDVRDPYGIRISWKDLSVSELLTLLGDDRHSVNQRSVQVLSEQGGNAIEPSKIVLEAEGASTSIKQQILWALSRIPGDEARKAVRLALNTSDAQLLRTAIHVAGIHRDVEALPALTALLRHEDPFVCRKAVEGIGRIGEPEIADAILQHAHDLRDRAHEHALTYALIQVNASAETLFAALAPAQHPNVRRVALTVLSQLENNGLNASHIAGLLTAEDDALRDRAMWVAGFHPEWGGGLASHFESVLLDENQKVDVFNQLQRQLEVFVKQPEIQRVMGRWLDESWMDPEVKQLILQVMRHDGLRSVPTTWLEPVSRRIYSDALPLVTSAIETVSQWTLTGREREVLLPALEYAASREGLSMAARLAVFRSITRFNPHLENEAMKISLAAYKDASKPGLREKALGIWRDATLESHQVKALLPLFEHSGPLHLSQLVDLFHGHSEPDLGEAFMQVIQKAPANASIRPDLLLHAVDSFPEQVQDQARFWLKSMEVDVEEQRRQLQGVLAKLPEGNVRRGQAVFNSENTACSTCHQIGYVGGQTGPDLTRIGSVRNERDLLEAILFPSVSFVRSYEPMIVETHDGEEFSGVMLREGGGVIRLVAGAGIEMRLEQGDIDSIRPSQVSVMPSGLDEQLSRQELADLLAFLKSRQ
ncbi:MAG: c-type cytochrome [Limisphaerales bacterium]|nr:MAG: c-type cytochrome [Limisphaerales bacterium]